MKQLFFIIRSTQSKTLSKPIPSIFSTHHRHSSSSTPPPTTRVALYLHRARLIDSLRRHLRSPLHPPPPPPTDPFVACAALRSAPSPSSALSLFRSLPSPAPNPVLHSLAKVLSKSKRLPDLRSLIAGSAAASPMDRLRWLSAAGDLDSSLSIFDQMRRLRRPCSESYNLIMGLYVSNQMDSDAVSTFNQMVRDGAIPNSRTFTVLIDHLVAAGEAVRAWEVFARLPSMRVRRTSRQYSSLASGFDSIGRFDLLRSLIAEMRHVDGLLPNRAMRDALKKMREAGFVEETEAFVGEFSPDDRIGCVDDGSSSDGDDEEGVVELKRWIDPNALAGALEGWEPSEVSELEGARIVWTTRLVCKMLRAFKNPETAWEFFNWVAYQPGGFAHGAHTVSRMIVALARHGLAEPAAALLSKIEREEIKLPFSTVRLVIDSYGLSKRADDAVGVFGKAETLCGPIAKPNWGLLCSSLLRTLSKCGRSKEMMELAEEMIESGVFPDAQTFVGMVEHFAREGDLKAVQKVVGMVRQCGLEPDGFMNALLIRTYCKHERAAVAMLVFEDMRASDGLPDARTKELLVRSLWKEGKMKEVAVVEESCEGEALPEATVGHAWTVSASDFAYICDIYSSSFKC